MPLMDMPDASLGDNLPLVVSPGEAELQEKPEPVSWGRVFGAAFRHDNPETALLSRDTGTTDGPEINPWDAIKDTPYQHRWESFVGLTTQSQVDAMKRQLDQEDEDNTILEQAPWWMSALAQTTAGGLSTTSLIPGGAFLRGAKGGFSVLKSSLSVGAAGALAVGAQEALLQAAQETRTAQESVVNLSAGAVIAGLLGAGGAKLLTGAERLAAVQAVNQNLMDIERGYASGATPTAAGADVPTQLSLEELSVAGRAAGMTAAATQNLNPLLRALHSPSAVFRSIMFSILENPVYLKAQAAGVATGHAAETFMKQWSAGLNDALQQTHSAWKDYRKAGGTLKEREFREQIGHAAREEDTHADPFIDRMAKVWRAQVFEPLKNEAINHGLLAPDVTAKTAKSYLHRMWNQRALIGRPQEFKSIVENYYTQHLAEQYAEDVRRLAAKHTKWDQELEDRQLPADQRMAALDDIDEQLELLSQRAGSLVDQDEHLSELRSRRRLARKEGRHADAEAADQELKAAIQSGGPQLKAFQVERARLTSRKRHVDWSDTGVADRRLKLADRTADIEEANIRGLTKLVERGQKFERELQSLPENEDIHAKLEALETRFNQTLRREEEAFQKIAQLKAQFEDAQAAANKRVSDAEAKSNFAAIKELQATAPQVQAAGARINRALQAQQNRLDQLNRLAFRIGALEHFDRDAMLQEWRDINTRLIAVASDRSLARGERAARLQERMAALGPDRVAKRLQAVRDMKTRADEKFMDKWETKRLGRNVDPRTQHPEEADFREQAHEIAEYMHRTLTGRLSGALRPEYVKIGTRGAMKDRTFLIPDALVNDFLEHDIAKIGQRYVRQMGADVELFRKLGSVNGENKVAEIRESYARLMDEAPDEKTRLKLAAREKSDLEDFRAMIEKLRGMENDVVPGSAEDSYARLVRNMNMFNYLRLMGMVALASLPEVLRPAMVHGLLPYLHTMKTLATDLEGIKMSVRDAKLAGNVGEWWSHSRLGTLADIFDPYSARGPVESLLDRMTDVASKWNGIALLTDAQKSIAAVMTQNRIIDNVLNFSNLSKKEKAYMAWLNIDEAEAERLAKMFNDHGETRDSGVRIVHSDRWVTATDPAERAAQENTLRNFRAALNKDVDSIITTAGAGDVPNFANTTTGKVLFQFKRFFLASHQRVLLRGLQEDQTQFLSGMLALATVGMMVTYLRALAGNRHDKLPSMATDPGWWLGEGLDRSGIMAVPIELSNMFEAATGFNPVKSPLQVIDEGNRPSQRLQHRGMFTLLGGPTAGAVNDFGALAGIPYRMARGEEVTQGQTNAGERILPYSTYLGIQQMLRYFINPQED